MTITIIGAGIGGLTTAIALKQKGFEVEVFESFASFKPLGSGINLANNAMQVYRQLGLYDRILAQSNPVVGIAVSLRNHLMGLTPSSVGQKQSAYLFKVPGLS